VFNLDISQVGIFPQSVESPMTSPLPCSEDHQSTTCDFPTLNSVLYIKKHHTASPKAQ